MKISELFEARPQKQSVSVPTAKPRAPNLATKTGDGRHKDSDELKKKKGKFRKLKHPHNSDSDD